MGTLGKSMAMEGLLRCLLLLGGLSLTLANSDPHSGFPTWIPNNLEEFENVAVSWDNSSAVPAWLKGTYFKNGPARQDFGGKLSYGNMADGWAKITKFNVDSSGVRVSSKFLKTQTYRDCEAAREIVPQMTMGPVYKEDGSTDGWGMGDIADIASHTDNTIVTITKMGSEFIASTDLPKVNIFSPSTLEWIGYYDPKLDSTMSTAHWAPEPGTDNMLNYHGRHYCYAYGQAIVDVRRQYLVKKNVCDSTEDKIWYKEEHYSGEPIFIPNPDGTTEDDGVLLVIVLDGSTQLSYLLLLDGKSFETLAEARLDTFIPMSIHGSWFDEIF